MKLNNILSLLPRATVILACALMPAPGDCSTADLAREQRLVEQIVDAIFEGEPVYLAVNEHRFLPIHTPSESQPVRGAATILHGRGTHPDREQVTNPMRTRLPTHGWDTLSLQMPVLETGEKR